MKEQTHQLIIGDRIGTVTGPGEWPEDHIGFVFEIGQNEWGSWAKVLFPGDAETEAKIETISGSLQINRGIGIYYLGHGLK